MSQYTSMSEFAIAVERAWEPYRAYIISLAPGQVDGPADPAGWTVKDHITHVTAWEEGIRSVLQGRPRHEGMGISEEDLAQEDIDDVNEQIRRAWSWQSAEEAVKDAILKHEGFMMEVEALPEDAVHRTRANYLGEPDPEPVHLPEWLWMNSGNAYGLHLEYIRRIVDA